MTKGPTAKHIVPIIVLIIMFLFFRSKESTSLVILTAHKLVNNIVFIHIQIHKLIKELKYEMNVMAPPENNQKNCHHMDAYSACRCEQVVVIILFLM